MNGPKEPATALRVRDSLVPLWMIVAPFVVTTLYVLLTPLPPPRFGWAILLGSVLLGASFLLLLPMRWWRRVLAAVPYIVAMLVMQFLFALILGCAARNACI